MGAIDSKTTQEALKKISSFRKQLSDSQAHKMLDGTLYELVVHFLQRSMPYSYCFDLDFIVLGFKNHEPLIRAIIEVKTEKRSLSKNQQAIYLKIAQSLGVPAYLLSMINHNKFQIRRFDKEENLGFFTYRELTKWFQDLTNGFLECQLEINKTTKIRR